MKEFTKTFDKVNGSGQGIMFPSIRWSHGGKIWPEGKPDEGATFTIRPPSHSQS